MSDNNITMALVALIDPLQSIEDSYQQLLTERTIYTSIGAQLDQIGKKVGESVRAGDDDDTYRRRVWARISTNRSDGLVEQMITISRLIVNDANVRVEVERQQPATLVIRLEDEAVSTDVAVLLFAFLRNAVAGGVKLILTWGSTPVEEWFEFDGGPGFDDDGAFVTAISEATVMA